MQIRPDTALYLSCNNKNVIIKAQPDGVLPVADFRWSTGETSVQFLTVYQTGTYAVTITAVNGCESRGAISVTADMTLPNVSIVPVPANAMLNCNTASVILDAVSTTPSATFRWNTGATTSAITATTAGIYTVTASNPSFGIGNGCTATAQVEVKNNNPVVSLGADRVIASGQSATLTAAVTKGVAPFAYLWSTGSTTPSVSVTTAGNYSVTVTDASGCRASDTLVVTISGGCTLALGVSQNNNYCFGSSSGSIYVGYVGNGVAPYQYSFDGGQTFTGTSNAKNLAAGTYIVVVKDANNCTGTKTIIITEGAKINFTTTTTTTCNNTGSITISNVSGGNGTPYLFAITNLPAGHPYNNAWVTNTVFSNLPPNTYFVKVRDASGCSTQPPVSVVVGGFAGFSATITGNSTVCFGSTTPINAIAAGGTSPFTYSWIKPNGTIATSQSIQAGVGNYFVTITDASGCTASASKTITGTNGVTAAIEGNTALCPNTTTTLNATGWEGVTPYTFTWSTGKTGTTTNSTSGVSITVGAGNYCVTVTDANGCTSTLCKTVTASTLAVAVTGNLSSCTAQTTTALTATATYGLAPYLYRWSTGSTANVITVGAGTYTVTVTDASGCTVSNTTTLTPSALTLTLDSVAHIKCNGSANGRIYTSVTGGTGSIRFTRTNFATSQSQSYFLNLTPNTYTIQAKDGNGCLSNILTTTITEPNAIVFSTTKTDESCVTSLNGTITVTATGGVAPLLYSRNNGASWQSSAIFTGLSADSYSIKVRDANLCTSATQYVTVSQPTGFTFATVTVGTTCNGGTDGKTSVRYFSGGIGAPYQFSKDNGISWQLDSVFSNLAVGNYQMRMRDGSGCISPSRIVAVGQPTAITFTNVVGNVT
jgi:large repetitive protein